MATLAGVPDKDAFADLTVLLVPADARSLRRWLALGELGALAWAAGLGIEEAETRGAAGTLDAGRLRLLAGLRGWQFPPAAVRAPGPGRTGLG